VRLEEQLARSKDSAATLVDGSSGEGAPSKGRVADLLEVLAGAVRAVKEAPVHLGCA